MTITTYLERLLAHAGIEDAVITMEETPEVVTVQIDVPETEVGVVIGYHGETLSAIQRMARLVFRTQEERKIILNVNDYRDRRNEKIVDMVKSAAQKVLDSGESYTFGYLPSNERFVVHSTITTDPAFSTLESVSEGEGAERRLTIRPKTA